MSVLSRTAYDLDTPRDDHWSDRAVCRNRDPELFFPLRAADEGRAKRVCRHCPVRLECGAWAVQTEQLFGVWGGMSEYELRRAVRQRRERR